MAQRNLSAAVRRELAKYPNLDPAAVLAVAAQEGLGGGIGDGGHAYGPFQLNNAGGVITGSHPGVNDPATQAWASSPTGIDFALSRIEKVAGGLKGKSAVQAIVNRFERPANPGREIAGALGAYDHVPAGAGPQQAPLASAAFGRDNMVGSQQPQAQPQPHDFRPELASQLAAAAGTPSNDLTGFYGTLGAALRARQQAQRAPQAAAPTMTPPGPHAPGRATLPGGRVIGGQGEQASFLAQLAQLAAFEHAPVQINSGYRSTAKQAQLYANRASNPNPVAPPGHSLHEQGLAADGTVNGTPLGTLPPAVLRRFGLYTVPGDPVHIQARR